jgi:hypothetical protein
MALTYFVNRKKTTCVISFTGSLSPNDAELLHGCLAEAVSEPARHYILNLGGMKGVDLDASRPFTLFQQGLRAESKLYLCSLPPEVARTLKGGGVIREGEIFPDLLTCLQAILNVERE